MTGHDNLDEFEHIVLLALLQLGNRAYGVTVRREIRERIQHDVSMGALYATLQRLQDNGYVKSSHGDPTPERGMRSKRFFQVTAKGISAVSRTHQDLNRLTHGLTLVPSCP